MSVRLLVPSIGRKRRLARLLRAELSRTDGVLLGSDLDPLAPALEDVDIAVGLPAFDADDYWEALDVVVREYAIDAVLPVRDAELVAWAKRSESGRLPVASLLPDAGTLAICRDKTRLYDVAQECGIACPEWSTSLAGSDAWVLPRVVKPVTGSGSRGLRLVDSLVALRSAVEEAREPLLVQEWREGTEYSVDCLANRDGELIDCCVRERRVVEHGECIDGDVVRDPELAGLCARLAQHLVLRGVFNVQFIRDAAAPWLIDLNPRFPGGIAITERAGHRFVARTVEMLSGVAGLRRAAAGAKETHAYAAKVGVRPRPRRAATGGRDAAGRAAGRPVGMPRGKARGTDRDASKNGGRDMAHESFEIIEKEGYCLTNYRVNCRRGVMWLGQTCNLRCHFCYFLDKINDKEHPEHPFMPLEKAKAMCRTMVEVYGNSSVDIQGGEPTIYRHIHELLSYCREIGLKPTLITNAIVLDNVDRCHRLMDAGLFDLLVSVQGIGEVYDRVVGVPNGSRRQLAAIDNFARIGLPFRINTVLSPEVLHQLSDIGELAIAKGARAVNFIAFNPFVDQSLGDKRSEANVPRYGDIVARLLPVIDRLTEAEIEVNVRYLPFCLFPERYRRHVQNFQQIIYDLHEWESASEIWTAAGPQRVAASELSPPVDFEQHLLNLRATRFSEQLSTTEMDQRIVAVTAAVARAVNRLARLDRCRVAVFGNDRVGRSVIEALVSHPTLSGRVAIDGFVSSDAFRKADTLHGYPWRSDVELADDAPDIVVNCSDSYREEIDRILAARCPGTKVLHYFGDPETGGTAYSPAFYLPELAEVEGYGERDYAYKEYRVLMPKFIHPYSKDARCASCSVNGICDGFHADYARFHGFGELQPIPGRVPVHDPRHYMQDQMKVVEADEYDWALPPRARVAHG